MLTIALIRPGESEYDRQRRVQGNLDVPLSDEGSRQVEQIVAALRSGPPEIVYGPACEPAWETTERVAAALGLKAKQLADMENVNHGLWQGLLIDEVKRKQPKVYRQWQENSSSVCPPDGETICEAVERVQTCLAKLMKKHKEGRIGLVLPEPLASLVRVQFGLGEARDLWNAGADRPAVEWIEARMPIAVPR